jgi:concanavalin A-like lectin/glucanase superfamily protein
MGLKGLKNWRRSTVRRAALAAGALATSLLIATQGGTEVGNAAGSVPSSGLKLWLKADAGVTSSGGSVSRWADQSGSGTDATQATASSQPSLIANAVNGRPGLRFDGVDDFLNFTLPVNGLTGMSMFMVSSNSSDRNGGTVSRAENAPLFWGETSSWGTVYLSPFQTNVKFRFGTGQTNNWPSYTRPASIGSAFSRTSAIHNGSTDILYVDGQEVLREGGKLSSIAKVKDTATVGRGFWDNTYFPGTIAEVLVYNRALSDSERQGLDQYLQGRYSATATATPTTPPSTSTPTPVPTPQSGGSQPTILKSYSFGGDQPVWSRVFYLPWQFKVGTVVNDPSWGNQTVEDAGAYANWDLLVTPNDGVMRVVNRADWLTLQLTRPSKLAVVWRWIDPIPNWLQSWTPAGDIVVNGSHQHVYTKSFSAGQVVLGAVFDPTDTDPNRYPRNTYWVLAGESNGAAPAVPAVPSGQVQPVPNQTCPTWVHDQYSVTAPDGKTYATWHPQIDPVYWCYFRHDHGSDPSQVASGLQPIYGYASAADNTAEGHQGFKSYAFDDGQGRRWLLSHHMGTGSIARACNRYHEVGIVVASSSTGEILADVKLMGDFGKAVSNLTQEPLTPPNCPNQAALSDADGSNGKRQLPMASNFVGYEPWMLDGGANIVGLKSFSLVFNTKTPITACNDLTCSQPFTSSINKGNIRFFNFAAGFGIVAGANTGTFYTNGKGTVLMSAGQTGAVRQYVKASLVAQPPYTGGSCFAIDHWSVTYVCGSPAPFEAPANLEGALASPN